MSVVPIFQNYSASRKFYGTKISGFGFGYTQNEKCGLLYFHEFVISRTVTMFRPLAHSESKSQQQYDFPINCPSLNLRNYKKGLHYFKSAFLKVSESLPLTSAVLSNDVPVES